MTRRRALRAAALTAVTALALAAFATAPARAADLPPEGPPGDAFYLPPSPLPDGRPGDVIRQRKQAEDATSTTYLVLYLSRNAKDEPNAVSGTVVVPKGKDLRTAPVIGVAPGTTGLGDQCAASKGGLVSSFTSPRGELLKAGYAIATTDYEGLGTPGVHTYVVGRSEGHAVLDVVRAAHRLGLGLRPASPVGLWGYSQGGGGAAWAAEQAPSYAPELTVRGTVAGGIPADMIAMGEALDGSLAFGFLAAAAAGFDAAYPELDLRKYLNPAGRTLFDESLNTCVDEVISSLAFKRIATYTTTNPMDRPDWKARLTENSLGKNPPRAPIFMFHGIVDEVVPYGQADALHRRYCEAGVNVTWSIQAGEHVTSALTAQGDGVRFLKDRIAGKPTWGTCWLIGH